MTIPAKTNMQMKVHRKSNERVELRHYQFLKGTTSFLPIYVGKQTTRVSEHP